MPKIFWKIVAQTPLTANLNYPIVNCIFSTVFEAVTKTLIGTTG